MNLKESVDVLRKPEAVDSVNEPNVNKYGVIVSKEFKKGLLLPNLEGVDTPHEQVGLLFKKQE